MSTDKRNLPKYCTDRWTEIFHLFIITIIIIIIIYFFYFFKFFSGCFVKISDCKSSCLQLIYWEWASPKFSDIGKVNYTILLGTYHKFRWYATFESKLPRAFGDSPPSIMRSLYGVKAMPMLFSNIWRSLCSLFVQHDSLLFFKFTLASGVFCWCRGLAWALWQDFCTWGGHLGWKFGKSTEIHPRLITQPGRQKQDKSTVGDAIIA